MKRTIGYLISLLITVSIITMVDVSNVLADTPQNTDSSSTICKGVFVDDIELSDKTKEEAVDLVNTYLEDLLNKKIIVKANDKEVSVDVKSLDAEFVQTDYVEQALNIGKMGNVVKRYKDIKDVENDKKVYKVEIKVNDDKLSKFVDTKATECNIEPKEPTMVPKSSRLSSGDIASQFTYKEGSSGKSIDVKEVKKAIEDRIANWDKQDIVIEAKTSEEKPKHNIEELKNCNAKLATFTTRYYSSSSLRCNNISNAASKINGKVLYVGDVFSMLKTVTPFTKANGYYEAGSYSQGKVVDSIGGGVCQVSSTLYNAVLRAELEVVKRNNHSMIVSYVDKSADAMISEGAGQDFKFKNNSDAPVYIEAYTAGKTITFNIYGHETRSSSRTLRFESKVISTIQPGKDVITVDKTLPASYRRVTQSAHTGYKAEYYKIVYENGVEKQRIKVNSSYYKAAPNYITVGGKADKPKEEVEDNNANKDNNGKNNVSDNKTPSVSTPQTTVKPTQRPNNAPATGNQIAATVAP